jgi:hypothetical protein
MARVGRVLGRAVIALAIVAGLLWPVVWAWLQLQTTEEASDPVSIGTYDATYVVQPDGRLVATEQIRAEFPGGRHGIFRYWDVADPADPSVRYLPTIVSVTRDGRPEPYDLYWQSGYRFLVAKIGEPNTYLDFGTHTYVISYQIPGAVSPASTSATAPWVTTAGEDAGAPGSAFLWSVVASGWEMPIANADVTIQLPSPSGAVQCATDPWGTPGPCTVAGAGTQTFTVLASSLAPRTGMIVRAAMQPDAPPRGHLPWSVTWDPVLGRTPWVTVSLVLLAIAAGLAGFQMARSTREQEPGFPVQYEPPAGLGPVQVVYLDSEGSGPAPLVASLLHMADRGLVRLERPVEDTWRITDIATPQQWTTVDPVTWSVAQRLGLMGGATFSADGSESAGKVLKSADDAFGAELSTWSEHAGLMTRSPREQGLKALWFVLAAVSILFFALPGILSAVGLLAVVPTLIGLVPAAFVLAGATLTSRTVGQRHTPQGQMAWARAGGFRRLLSTPSSEERFDFSARTDAFIHFIPYAVALGVADKWADKYRTEMGTEPPIPIWYPMYVGHSMSGFYSGGDFDSFSKSVTASIGAYAAAQAASHGGGGGGGFGGGGGGGGGSW